MKSKLLNGLVGLLVLGASSLSAQFDDLYSDPIKREPVKKEFKSSNNSYVGGQTDNDYYDADGTDYYNDERRSADVNYYDDLDFTYSRRINAFHRSNFAFNNPYRFGGMYDPFGYSFNDPFFDPFWGGNNIIVNVGIGSGFGWNRWNRWNNWGFNNGWNNGWNSWGFNNGWNNGWNSWGNGWGNNVGWNSFGWNSCPPSWNRPVFVNNYINNVGGNVNSNPNGENGRNIYYGSRNTSSTTTSTAGRVDGPRSYRGDTPSSENVGPRSRGTDPTLTTTNTRRSGTETSGARPSIYSRGSTSGSATTSSETGRTASTSRGSSAGQTERSVYSGSRNSDSYSGARTSPSSNDNYSRSSSPSRSSDTFSSGSSRSSSSSSSSSSAGSSRSSGGSSSSGSSSGGGRSSGRGG